MDALLLLLLLLLLLRLSVRQSVLNLNLQGLHLQIGGNAAVYAARRKENSTQAVRTAP